MVDLMQLFTAKAKEKKRTLVICEAWDERPLRAIQQLIKEDLCNFIILEKEGMVRSKAASLGIDLSRAKILDFLHDPLKETLMNKMYELRKEKGMTLDQARVLIGDYNYFGCMMVVCDLADAVCSSCICSTAAIMHPALQLIKTKPGVKTVSAITAMIDKKHDDRLYFLTDDSIVIAPTPEQRADIVFNAAEIIRGLGMVPKVALLSHSTHGSGEHPVLEPIRETLKICRARDPTLLIDGEMQADTAISADAASKKAKDLVVKGDANILVFPEIMSGNIAIHILMKLTDNDFYIFLAGMKKPVGVFGRSTPWTMHVHTMVMCAAQCNM